MNLNIKILKQFDGTYNYFNCTGLNGRVLYRRQKKYKYKGNVLVSDIVDENDNIILEAYETKSDIICYEDPRFITNNEISVCECILDIDNPLLINEVKFKTYNLLENTFNTFKTQNTHFEKHWQFYDDKIIYHVNPFTILDRYENILYKRQLDFTNWINLYGTPRLSTNIFEINGCKYLIFHSCILKQESYLRYYIGLMRINDDLTPLGYYITPFIEHSDEYVNMEILSDMRKWRDGTKFYKSAYYDVIFPLNVEVNGGIKIFGGFNDCSAGYIDMPIDVFLNRIKNKPFILFG